MAGYHSNIFQAVTCLPGFSPRMCITKEQLTFKITELNLYIIIFSKNEGIKVYRQLEN
jgi:hypothetical protein